MDELLNAHFEKMQDMCRRYLEPNGFYVSIDGEKWEGPPADLDALFIADMIYMLDGPEQREAQAASR
jgi:hypothetical protein